MSEQQRPESPGIMVLGADGALYYITDTALQAYKLPDDVAATVTEAMTSEVQGYQSSPIVRIPFQAAQRTDLGPLGTRAGPSSPTTSIVNFGAFRG